MWLCQCDVVSGMYTMCKRREVGSVVDWAKGRGFEFESEEGWKGGGLVVGWGGCECDGLVSNTLSLSVSVTSTHSSRVSHSPVCFKAIVLLPLQSVCWCCCVVPLLPFVQSPFSLTIVFGDDVVAEQPSQSCLVIHNTVYHVTPCALLSSEHRSSFHNKTPTHQSIDISICSFHCFNIFSIFIFMFQRSTAQSKYLVC